MFVPMRQKRRLSALFAAALLGLLALAAPELEAAPPARSAVATESATTSREALAVLAAGGNAIDAAVCAALVTGVVSPTSSGLGGGGFAMVWLAAEKRAVLLDFRETAPRDVDVAALQKGVPPSEERGKLVGTPGELAGLYELHRRHGKMPWASLVARAENLARGGFAVEGHLAAALSGRSAQGFQRDASLKALFYPGGKAVKLGQRLRRPNLAKTLASIKTQGPAALYSGPVAAELAKVVREHGGALSEEDLKSYQVKERTPLARRWDNYDVLTMPPPSSGGLILSEVLAWGGRDAFRRLGLRTPLYMHMVGELVRGGIADRMRYVGDPDQVKVDTAALLEPERLARRAAMITPDRTHAARSFARGAGTHHLSVLDSDGNAVALTTTVNGAFGADIVAPASGIVLNDQLDDFFNDGEVRAYDVPNPNPARPGARPTSSMTPTIVLENGRVVLALGASGGTDIPASVLQVLLARLVFDEPIDKAVAVRRFYPAYAVPTLRLDEGWSERELAELAWRGERTTQQTSTGIAVQVVENAPDGARAAADPRKFGLGLTR